MGGNGFAWWWERWAAALLSCSQLWRGKRGFRPREQEAATLRRPVTGASQVPVTAEDFDGRVAELLPWLSPLQDVG